MMKVIGEPTPTVSSSATLVTCSGLQLSWMPTGSLLLLARFESLDVVETVAVLVIEAPQFSDVTGACTVICRSSPAASVPKLHDSTPPVMLHEVLSAPESVQAMVEALGSGSLSVTAAASAEPMLLTVRL